MGNDDISWVSLHQHTEYSLLDSSAKIPDLLKRASELGMKSMAITDHGVMYGCVDFYKEAKANGIKPIIGCEIYVSQGSMHVKSNNGKNRNYHLVLLVKNEVGYRNLMQIVSTASIEGFYYKPRVDHDYLKNHSSGLIALSACLSGEVQANILDDNLKGAKEAAEFYRSTFKDGFYLELQYHGIEDQLKVNREIRKMSRELEIPMVVTNDVHYINKSDSRAHDILLCIQTGKTVEDQDRMRYPSDQFYLKSPEEMYDMFKDIPEAFENTVKIAEECNFDYEFHKSKLPKFPLPENQDAYEYLRDLCCKGLERRYKTVTQDLKDRLEYELGVINQMGYVDYFLIVWDFIRFAREKGIMTGPGRGSGAGSIVAYTLGITKIDPIKYNLIFERFLNPERVSMPDIDSDFCYERRGEVIDYVVKKYGKQNVSQIVTFGTMAARACIRDVGRAMNYPYGEVDRIAKMIPAPISGHNVTIDKALEMNPELKGAYEDEDRTHELIDVARALEGLPRHTSTHAAGVVISSKPLVDYVPLQKNDDNVVTQFTMGTLEELGLLKMDFLGLRTLTVLRDTVAMVRENRNIDINLDSVDYDDKKVYSMIGSGRTTGVFQLESPGMTSFMKELKPDSLEDIIAGISLYRPGPMSEIPKYIKNKKNPKDIEYMTPKLEHILSVTYGCMVYQEQVMQIVRDLAGYSMGRSDLVRRAMSKKKHHVMEEERHNFVYGIVGENDKVEVPGCIRNGISEEIANKLFDSMMDFASYAFNKSHAAAYAVVAFQTAYLMCYYPVEYTAAMLNSVKGDSEKVAYYIRFAKDLGIEVLPPDINESFAKFTVSGNSIRFGLSAVKNVGENIINSIVESRKKHGHFKDIVDFCSSIDVSAINKRVVESLVKSGAFDCFGIYRSKLVAVHEKVIEGITNSRKKNIKGQISLFSTVQDDNLKIRYPEMEEFSKRDLLSMEKQMTGLYLSGHPLDEYEKTLKLQTSIKISDIVANTTLEDGTITESKVKDGDKVIIGGIISELSRKITKNNDMMAFASLEDLYGIVELIIFPKVFQKFRNLVHEDSLIIVKGRVSMREEEQPKVLCDTMEPMVRIDTKKLYILIQSENQIKDAISHLKTAVTEHRGNVPIYICTKNERHKFRLDSELWVKDEHEVVANIEKMFGEKNVKLI